MIRRVLACIIVFSGCSSSFLERVPSDLVEEERDRLRPEREEYEMNDVLKRFRPGVTLTGVTHPDGKVEKSDLRVSLSAAGSRVTGRSEMKMGRSRSSFFLENRALSRRLRLYAGDFMPDLALGSVFAGYRFSYPFSSGYPLRNQRAITRHTSFYGTSIRGAALRAGTSRSSLLVFSGRAGKWNDDGLELEKGGIYGARIESSSGGMRVGLTMCSDDRRLIAGLDHTIENRNYRISCELSRTGGPGKGIVWGMRRKTGPGRIGFLFFRLPAGTGFRFGDIPGGIGDLDSDRMGVSVVGAFTLSKTGRLRYSFERRIDRKGEEREMAWSSRMEFSTKLLPGSWRFSYTIKDNMESDNSFFPPGEAGSRTVKEKLDILLSSRHGRNLRIRVQAGSLWSRRYRGHILSQSARIASSTSRFNAEAFSAVYRSLRGRPAFYNYEPVLSGSYPWKFLSGNGWRAGVAARLKIGRTSMNFKFAQGGGDGMSIDMQIAIDL